MNLMYAVKLAVALGIIVFVGVIIIVVMMSVWNFLRDLIVFRLRRGINPSFWLILKDDWVDANPGLIRYWHWFREWTRR